MKEAAFASRGGRSRQSVLAGIRSYALTFAIVAISTLVGLWVVSPRDTVPVAMIYLMAVVASATLWGIGQGSVAGISAALAFDFFFTEPMHTFRMDRTADEITVVALLVVALVVSRLAGRLSDHIRSVASEAAQNAVVAGFAGRLLTCNTEEEISWATCAELGRVFACNTVLLAGFPKLDVLGASPRGVRLTPSDITAAAFCIESAKPAGRGTDRASPADWLFHPVRSTDVVLAAVGFARDNGTPPIEDTQLVLLANLLDQLALALTSSRRR